MDDIQKTTNDLKNLLGADLLCFMLDIEAKKLDEGDLNNKQLQVIPKLKPCIDLLKGQNGFEKSANTSQLLCTYEESLKTSWASYLHYFCKGIELPTFDYVRDNASRNIMLLSRDTYPVLLVQRSEYGGMPDFMSASYKSPFREKFVLEITKSRNPIRKLFPNIKSYRHYKNNPEEIHSLNSNLVMSNGQIETISAFMLPESILSSSTFTTSGRRDPITAYTSSVLTQYKKIKRVANGGEISINSMLGLGNVDISPDIDHIKKGRVLIRRICAIDKFAMIGNYDNNASIVAEISEPQKILEIFNAQDDDEISRNQRYEKYSEELNDSFNSRQDMTYKIRLAMLLCSNVEGLVSPTYVFTTSLSPLSSGRSAAVSPYRWNSSQYERREISNTQANEFCTWLIRLERLPKKLDVSLKRLISASMDRMDASDAFIDAAMVWENLFGAKQETTLRIKGAISLLLEPTDQEKRRLLMKEVNTLYEKRSRLVHGAPNVDLSEIHLDRDRSIDIAIRCFKRVLMSRRLLEAKDSEERGQIIMFNIMK